MGMDLRQVKNTRRTSGAFAIGYLDIFSESFDDTIMGGDKG